MSLCIEVAVEFCLRQLFFFLAIGSCDPTRLPGITNGQRKAVREFRQSVFRYSCNKGFTLVGEDMVYCDQGEWSMDTAPLCISE